MHNNFWMISHDAQFSILETSTQRKVIRTHYFFPNLSASFSFQNFFNESHQSQRIAEATSMTIQKLLETIEKPTHMSLDSVHQHFIILVHILHIHEGCPQAICCRLRYILSLWSWPQFWIHLRMTRRQTQIQHSEFNHLISTFLHLLLKSVCIRMIHDYSFLEKGSSLLFNFCFSHVFFQVVLHIKIVLLTGFLNVAHRESQHAACHVPVYCTSRLVFRSDYVVHHSKCFMEHFVDKKRQFHVCKPIHNVSIFTQGSASKEIVCRLINIQTCIGIRWNISQLWNNNFPQIPVTIGQKSVEFLNVDIWQRERQKHIEHFVPCRHNANPSFHSNSFL